MIGHIVIGPNNSVTWRTLKFFLLTLMTISFCVAIGFTLAGYWVILPFSVLEMSIVAFCLFHIAQRCNYQQVLRFYADEIVIEEGHRKVETAVRWPRYFSKFLIQPARHPWYQQKIFIRHAEQSIELGKFLNPSDKKDFVREINQMIRAADQAQTELR